MQIVSKGATLRDVTMSQWTHPRSAQTTLECIKYFYKIPHYNKTITQHASWKKLHMEEKKVKEAFKLTSKLIWKVLPLVKVLWIGSSNPLAFVSGTRMKMMEFEVDINFTSRYIGDETFFRRVMVGTPITNIFTNFL